jgi:hypothetical protein
LGELEYAAMRPVVEARWQVEALGSAAADILPEKTRKNPATQRKHIRHPATIIFEWVKT